MITVATCTHNRAKSLKRTLACLKKLEPASEVELIVIDNASADNTKQVFDTFANDNPTLRYFYEENLGISHALNRAIKEAQGEIIAFIDDDQTVHPDWLKAIIAAFEDSNTDLIFTRLYIKDGEKNTTPEPNSMFPPRDYGEEPITITKDNHTKYVFGTGISAYRLSTLREMGPFRVDLGRQGTKQIGGEDTDMYKRYIDAKKRILYWPDGIVYHHIDAHRTTFIATWNRAYYIGVTDVRMNSHYEGKRIFGIPRFCFVQTLKNTANLLLAIPQGKKAIQDKTNKLARDLGRAAGMKSKKN